MLLASSNYFLETVSIEASLSYFTKLLYIFSTTILKCYCMVSDNSAASICSHSAIQAFCEQLPSSNHGKPDHLSPRYGEWH